MGLREIWQRARFRYRAWSTARRTRIILSAGMPRSGSTWLFNAARLMLQAQGEIASGWIDDWDSLPTRPVTLLKVHDYDAVLAHHASVILYSYRDIRDALASSRRKFNTEPTIELARQWLASDRQWRARATFAMRYESMRANPIETIERLALALGATIDPVSIAQQLDAIEYLERQATPGAYDRETLLHPGHITDGRHGTWQDWLDPDLIDQIEDECADWLAANGYPTTQSRKYEKRNHES